MDEQQILSTLRGYVARHEGFGPDEQCPPTQRRSVSSIAFSNVAVLSTDVWASAKTVAQLNPRNAGLLNKVAQAVKKLVQRSLGWYTRSLQIFHHQVARAIEEHGTAIDSMERALHRMQGEIETLQDQIPAIQRSQRKAKSESVRGSPRAADFAPPEQLAPYVDFFAGLSRVVDLGCGRGEFLLLLQERGISAYGVDSDRAACEAARGRSLKVIENDVFEHLRELPERSLEGIFSSRLIEYLPTHLQADFISSCSRKLKPGGVIVIETTNPETRVGFGRTCYLDLTHRRPVRAELLKSLLETNLLRDVKICTLAAVEADPSQDEPWLVAADHRARRDKVLSNGDGRLSGSPAYAAVAWRS